MDFSSLLSGVIGAALGVAGAFSLQWWDHRRRAKGEGRALFFELIQNQNAARAGDTPFPSAWSRATWEATQADMVIVDAASPLDASSRRLSAD